MSSNGSPFSNKALDENVVEGLAKESRDADEHQVLRDLVEQVVEQKLSQRDALQQLVLSRLSDKLQEEEKEIVSLEDQHKASKVKSKRPLKQFIDEHKKKLKKNEFAIHMAKGEQIQCPDCRKNIFNETSFSGCICLGEDQNGKLFIKKTENGVTVRFGHGWDLDNMEMLVEVLRKKRA